MNKKRLLVLSAPSGGGKTTVARYILDKYKIFGFSVSATTRNPRDGEVNGKSYYFFSKEEFKRRLMNDEFAEHEEIFGNNYGTLKSEIEKSMISGKNLIFDIDVKGALSIQRAYPEDSLLVFLLPPDIYELERRLRGRESESEKQIETRIARATMEISLKDKFDHIIVNNDLTETLTAVDKLVNKYFAGLSGS